jgi:hypothetical protein
MSSSSAPVYRLRIFCMNEMQRRYIISLTDALWSGTTVIPAKENLHKLPPVQQWFNSPSSRTFLAGYSREREKTKRFLCSAIPAFTKFLFTLEFAIFTSTNDIFISSESSEHHSILKPYMVISDIDPLRSAQASKKWSG